MTTPATEQRAARQSLEALKSSLSVAVSVPFLSAGLIFGASSGNSLFEKPSKDRLQRGGVSNGW